MDVYQEYKSKCCTADQAVQVVKDGDWVDYGMSCAYPTALDKALARRHSDLKDIKVRNAISCHAVAILEADPENRTFTYNLWHCSGIDRKYLDAGRAYHEPMLFRDCGSYYRRGFAPVDVAMPAAPVRLAAIPAPAAPAPDQVSDWGLPAPVRKARFQDFAYDRRFAAVICSVGTFSFVSDFGEALEALCALAHVLRLRPGPPKPRHPAVALVRAAIEADPAVPHDLASLAALAGVGPTYLQRLFVRETGMAVGQYLLARRVAHGVGQAAAGEGLAQAALNAGFCDQSHFTRQCKRRLGVPPGAYREWNGGEGREKEGGGLRRPGA